MKLLERVRVSILDHYSFVGEFFISPPLLARREHISRHFREKFPREMEINEARTCNLYSLHFLELPSVECCGDFLGKIAWILTPLLAKHERNVGRVIAMG